MAGEPTYGLSAEDVLLLRKMVERERQRTSKGMIGRSIDPEEYMTAPETYIALTGASGIPALTEEAGGTYPTTGTGSGDAADDVPGYAQCDVYQIIGGPPQSSAAPALKRAMPQVWVYNVFRVSIPPHTLVVVTRDKFGKWLVTFNALFGTC